jgi:hypothetical protein
MSVEIKNLDKINSNLEELSERAECEKIKNEIANFLSFSIKSRTAEGYDVNGNSFEGYSPKYKLFREEKGLPTYLVDLFFSGHMMSAMTYEVSKDEIRLFFQSTSDKKGVKNSDKAFYVNEKREFFSLNLEEIKEAVSMYEKYITEGF